MTGLKMLASRIKPVGMVLAPPPKRAERFYQSTDWRRLVARLKRERGNWCERCGAKGRIIGDHEVERKDGGAELDPRNVTLLCMGCHARKTAAAKAARAQGGPSPR